MVTPAVPSASSSAGTIHAEMGARRHLGHDAARRRVERDLARDDVRVDPPPALDERDAGLVAARFDRQQQRPAHAAPSPAGAWLGSWAAATPGSTGSGSSSGAGAPSIAWRRRATRSTIAGDDSGSVVMISASSWSSL